MDVAGEVRSQNERMSAGGFGLSLGVHHGWQFTLSRPDSDISRFTLPRRSLWSS
jgi:hypothetical protein